VGKNLSRSFIIAAQIIKQYFYATRLLIIGQGSTRLIWSTKVLGRFKFSYPVGLVWTITGIRSYTPRIY